MKTAEDLKSLQTQSILRLNCPGLGKSLSLSEGDAQPLTEYSVIIVNPVSIAHLFGEDQNVLKQIEMAQAEGLTSCRLADEKILERINQQIELRSPELFQFLAEGGLLIYYLCRPFVVAGQSRSLDNYAWLCGLAPDQSGESTMSEQTVRHMSALAHGRNIDMTPVAEQSKFRPYFEQVGLEWNTIIRSDFLTNGYTVLAQAGPKKCIAGELIAGDNGGRVIFFPAPYSPDFDRVLISCIKAWYAEKMGLPNEGQENAQSDIIEEPFRTNREKAESMVATILADQAAAAELRAPEPQQAVFVEQQESQMPEQPVFVRQEEVKIAEQPVFVRQEEIKISEQPVFTRQQEAEIPQQQVSTKQEEAVVSGKKASRIEPESIVDNLSTVPDWCKSYWLPGVDGLIKEIQVIRKQIKELEKKLVSNENTVSSLEEVKSTLLSGKPGDLLTSSQIILTTLGWQSKDYDEDANTFILLQNGNSEAVIRVAISSGSAERKELARLTETLIRFWDSGGSEPKGILIVCTHCDTPVSQRKEADFPETIIEFAKRKNICLISTTQLIGLYLDVKLGKVKAESARQSILSTSGKLSGFDL